MIKAVIFDVDGLLIDSEPLWDQVDIQLLKNRGHILSPDILKKRLGIGQNATVDLFKKIFKLPDKTADLLAERQEIFSRLFDKNPQLMPGVKQLIRLCVSKKLKLGIATGGHTKEKIEDFLRHFDLADYFYSITTGHEVTTGKPAPDIFLLTAKKLNTNPAECLVLEDAPSGVEAGKKAGMQVIGVNPNQDVRQKLKQSGADWVFPSLSDIGDKELLR